MEPESLNNKTIVIINFSDYRGGASIAAKLQYDIVRNNTNSRIKLITSEKKKPNVNERLSYFFNFGFRLISHAIMKARFNKQDHKSSLNIFSSALIKRYLRKNFDNIDIVHFHWINNETLSLFFIRELLSKGGNKRFVFTLHDDWFFCATEHASYDESYKNGYRNDDFFKLNIDYLIFNLKMTMLPFFKKSNVLFTVPSSYLYEKAKSSLLLNDANIKIIPNYIDCVTFQPLEQSCARLEFGLPMDRFIFLFGAAGELNSMKGADLLEDALHELKKRHPKFNPLLVNFGGKVNNKSSMCGFDLVEVGYISDKVVLAKLYSAVDCTVVPSRTESFGQVAAESLSCQTPVCAFNNSGLTDIVFNNISGFLVQAFDTQLFSEALFNVYIMSPENRKNLGVNGRKHILSEFSKDIIKNKWELIYNGEKNNE